MDFLSTLKGEIEKKRKPMEGIAGQSKYVKRSELEKERERKYLEEQKQAEEKKKEKEKEKKKDSLKNHSRESTPVAEEQRELTPELKNSNNSESKIAEQVNLSKISEKDIIKRFRKRGHPIRLFGETDEMRLNRLRTLEESLGDSMEGQQNDYMKNMSKVKEKRQLEIIEASKRDEKSSKSDQKETKPTTEELKEILDSSREVLITEELYKKSTEKVSLAIYEFFRRLLKEWEIHLDSMPEESKLSQLWRDEKIHQQQSVGHLESLFKLLKSNSLTDDILLHITRICQFMQEREYVEANNTYYLLSIGNSPWPIGVTMVGIHERSAREKIFSNQVAHVLNDEKTRKWIQSMKRLMTFCQSKYPPNDLAKTIGWVKK